MDRLAHRTHPWLPPLVTLAGAAWFLAQILVHAQSQASVLDEGLYLYKGWLFASGRYTPFQDYGPWSNHMPLSFLIPGWVQLLAGAGLQTGRALAAVTGLLSLAGTWLLARRFGGAWWAAGIVWAAALNPALIKIFSIQASQGLAACILIWACALILGSGRPAWQLVLGGALAAALPLTRINLLPVLPALVLYSYRVHGRRGGHLTAAPAAAVFIAGHAAFWPGILRLWAPWFPDALTPFLDAFRRPPNDGSLWSPQMGFSSRALSFLQGVRYHFLAVMAVLGAVLFWPRRQSWPEPARRKTALLVLGLFLLLFAMHAWAALAQDYCVFCFPVYLSFFSLIGLLLLPLLWSIGDGDRPAARWLPLILLVIGTALGWSAFDTVGAGLLDQSTVVQWLRTEVPRTSGDGTIPLWGLLSNRFGLDYETVVRRSLLWGRVGLSAMVGFLAAGLVLLVAHRVRFAGAAYPRRAFVLALAAGLVLSPSAFLGGGYRTYDCSGDVIAAYETAGAVLAGNVPAGARVYWGTGDSPVPLLYLPEAQIFPAQLNGAYSFKFGGDPDALERFGHWNQALAEEWAGEADVLLLSLGVFRDPGLEWLAALAEGGKFTQAESTPPVHPCAPDSQILIFVRK